MNTLKELYEMLHHPTINIEHLDTGLDYYKFNISRSVVKIFLCYPYVESLFFDFKEIERISKVWEGSDEETVVIGNRLLNETEKLLPKFNNIEDAFSYSHQDIYFNNGGKFNKNIIFIDEKQHYDEVACIYDYLTEEPSFPTALVKEHIANNLSTNFTFEHKFNDLDASKKLEADLVNFLGAKNYSLLLSNILDSEMDLNKINSKKVKI